MKIFEHVNSGERAELIERNSNTVTIKLASGERKELNRITLSRWWKEVQEENTDSTEAPLETGELKTPEEPMEMSAVIHRLEELFDILNALYFEDKLPKAVITVQSTPKAYGHCTTKKIWASETEGMYEINIGAEFLNRAAEETAATMCHEMVHLYCIINDIADTCQKGRYHNKTFKQEAESRDLDIEYNRTIGYSITSPTAAFKEKLAEAGFKLDARFARKVMTGVTRVSRTKQHKYVCPYCGQTVKSTAELNLICGDCHEVMECDD